MDYDQGLTEDDIFTAENGSHVDVKIYLRALRQKLQAAEQRAAEAERHLRAVLELEYIGNCPWCVFLYTDEQVQCAPDCPRQAAAAWLEAGDEGKGLEDKE